MNVVITGGAGFLGSRLARTVLAAEAVTVNGTEQPVRRLAVLDLAAPSLVDERLNAVRLDLGTASVEDVTEAVVDADVVFHLAGAVSAECEADFDLGMRSNLAGGMALLEACRRSGRRPVFVFSSSLAVYGQWPDHPLPAVVTDDTLPTPKSSYGIQKFVLEQLVADYTRKGFVDGRTVRLMTVTVRPGRPNAAASGFLSSIVREPLAGQPAVCPVPPTLEVALSSPEASVSGLLRAASASSAEWGSPTAVNLPALTTTVADMVAALAEVAGEAVTRHIQWQPDPQIAAVVGSWPARFDTARAQRLGLSPEPDFETIIRRYQQAL
jgi:nucleoside-diphosphate-sugar epimerase